MDVSRFYPNGSSNGIPFMKKHDYIHEKQYNYQSFDDDDTTNSCYIIEISPRNRIGSIVYSSARQNTRGWRGRFVVKTRKLIPKTVLQSSFLGWRVYAEAW